MEAREIYKKENNIFQSPEWLLFQENYGRKGVLLDGFSGVEVDLPFGKKADLVQRAPIQVSDIRSQVSGLPKGTVFVRFEPLVEVELPPNLRIATEKSILSGQRSPKATRMLNLTKSEEELLAGMKPKTRYNIKLAQKKGVVIEESKDVDIFYEMLVATSKKGGGYYPHEKEYYAKMISGLASKNLAKIFIAKHGKNVLAAILVTFYGETATYLHGGQNDVEKNLMAPYLCQWEAIRYAKKLGCKYYDFWGVSETDDPNDSWAGISRFKEGFGGEKVIFPGSYDLIINSFWYKVLTLIAKIKHMVRK